MRGRVRTSRWAGFATSEVAFLSQRLAEQCESEARSLNHDICERKTANVQLNFQAVMAVTFPDQQNHESVNITPKQLLQPLAAVRVPCDD
jgi:hypothetical protein